MQCKMKLNKETKGAVQYVEVDDKGNEKDIADSKIGILYVRKTSEIGSLQPKFIAVTVEQV